jgi:hypothetical protein
MARDEKDRSTHILPAIRLSSCSRNYAGGIQRRSVEFDDQVTTPIAVQTLCF